MEQGSGCSRLNPARMRVIKGQTARAHHTAAAKPEQMCCLQDPVQKLKRSSAASEVWEGV